MYLVNAIEFHFLFAFQLTILLATYRTTTYRRNIIRLPWCSNSVTCNSLYWLHNLASNLESRVRPWRRSPFRILRWTWAHTWIRGCIYCLLYFGLRDGFQTGIKWVGCMIDVPVENCVNNAFVNNFYASNILSQKRFLRSFYQNFDHILPHIMPVTHEPAVCSVVLLLRRKRQLLIIKHLA